MSPTELVSFSISGVDCIYQKSATLFSASINYVSFLDLFCVWISISCHNYLCRVLRKISA